MASLTPEGTEQAEPKGQAYEKLIADNRARNRLRLEQAGLSALAQNVLSHEPQRKPSKPREKAAVTNPRRSTRQATLEPVSYQEPSLAEYEKVFKRMSVPSPDPASSKTPGAVHVSPLSLKTYAREVVQPLCCRRLSSTRWLPTWRSKSEF